MAFDWADILEPMSIKILLGLWHNALIMGEKLWALFSPELSANDVGVPQLQDDEAAVSWFLRHVLDIAAKFPGKVFLAVQGRGDVLMLPTGWWHAVWNTTATVAVTENSVRKRDFERIWNELIVEDVIEKQEILSKVEETFGFVDKDQTDSG